MRIYKTRSLAASECLKGRIYINGGEAKPSRIVRSGDMVVVKKLPVIYTYRIKVLSERRLPAKEVEQYMDNLTSSEELSKLDMSRLAGFGTRDRGTGRPTKRERRQMDDFRNHF